MQRLSIIIPIYNAEKYLKECLDSVVGQMLPGDELILINDGSTDASKEICRAYVSGNVRVIDNTNQGVSHSRNCGTAVAAGEYITFVDADDYLLKGWRDTLAAGMETGGDIVYFTNRKLSLPDKDSLILSTLCIPAPEAAPVQGSACWGKLFKRAYLQERGLCFDREIINGEDSLFCLQALLGTENFSLVDQAEFYYYRTNQASATHTFNPRFNSSNIRYLTRVREELARAEFYTKAREKQIMDYITANGLYLLAYRTSLQADREKYFEVFDAPEYAAFHAQYQSNPYVKGFKKFILTRIRKKKVRSAVGYVRIYTKMKNLAKKVLKRK